MAGGSARSAPLDCQLASSYMLNCLQYEAKWLRLKSNNQSDSGGYTHRIWKVLVHAYVLCMHAHLP